MHSTPAEEHKDLGASNFSWDLSVLYGGPDDPRIEHDLKELSDQATKFSTRFKGQLDSQLGEAIDEYRRLSVLAEQPLAFLELQSSLDTGNQKVKTALARVHESISQTLGEHLTFMEIELAALDESVIESQTNHPTVRHHRPWIDKIRLFRRHLLTEPVERALAKRQPFGPSAWAQFFDEVEADLRVTLSTGELTLTQALHRMNESESAEERAATLAAIHQSFDGFFLKYSTETLMNTVRAKSLEDAERGYGSPLAARNLSNWMDDDSVEALHRTVSERAAPLVRRYYRLKAQVLDLERLAWSDRGAPLPFGDRTEIPFARARKMVEAAYASFSPTLAELVKDQFESKRVDAGHWPGKRGGAFNLSFCLNDGRPVSFTLLNYLGSARDVATLAHELGHGVHGLLAGKAQGALMQQAPMAYAETASVFGEMVTFDHLRRSLQKTGDRAGELRLLMEKCEDFANTVVRQIGFSNFERQAHETDRRLSPDELNELWLETTRELYGADGDVFTYANTERLWAYVGHFHRPFYVYAYAVGELVTRTLFVLREQFGERFEPLYLDLLRAGGSRPLVELLRPFGQDPTDPDFWRRGIETFEEQVEEAEQIFGRLETE